MCEEYRARKRPSPSQIKHSKVLSFSSKASSFYEASQTEEKGTQDFSYLQRQGIEARAPSII